MSDRPSPRKGSPTPPPGRGTLEPAIAGSLLVATIVISAAVGLALGALAGVAVVGLFAGIFVGFPLGVFVVRARFRDL